MTTNFSVSLSIYEPKNGRHVFFKSDGRRFDAERSVKVSCDTKYDVTVSIKPTGLPNLVLNKLVMGSDEITPDRVDEEPGKTHYYLTWITTGYQPTKKGARNDLRIAFKLADGELVFPIQVKFYPLSDSTHVVWGTVLRAIDLESVGNFQTGASPHQRFPLKKVSFR